MECTLYSGLNRKLKITLLLIKRTYAVNVRRNESTQKKKKKKKKMEKKDNKSKSCESLRKFHAIRDA